MESVVAPFGVIDASLPQSDLFFDDVSDFHQVVIIGDTGNREYQIASQRWVKPLSWSCHVASLLRD